LDKYQKSFLQEAKRQSARLQYLIQRVKTEIDGLQGNVPDIEGATLAELYHIPHKMKSISLILQYKKISNLSKAIGERWLWSNQYSGPAEKRKMLMKEAMAATERDFQQLFSEIEKLAVAEVESDVAGPTTLKQFGHLLIVDSDESSRKDIFQQFTSVGYQVEEALTVNAAKQMLYGVSYDLIVLNLSMTSSSGYALFDFLKSDPNFKWVPLIILSDVEDFDESVKCLDLGADDYIAKPVMFKYLLARVRRLLTRVREFEQMAFRDALTDVYNRRYFENHLSIGLHRIERTQEPMTIALLDIDRFKLVNDTYGHPVGDLVLQEIARILKDNLRISDLIARFGGEEFVLIFEKTTEKIASLMMDMLLQKVREHCMATVNGQKIYVTFSAGIASWEMGLTKDEWIERADQLLYYAKESGRNRCVTMLDMERV